MRDGKHVCVACHGANKVAVIDAGTRRHCAHQHGFRPRATVQKIDLATNPIVKTIQIRPGAGTHEITFAASGKLMLVTQTGTSTVPLIDTEHDEVLGEIKVGTAPE